MNANQIAILREAYMLEAARPDGRKSTAGEYMRLITDCNLEFVTSKDMVLFDDTNEIVHCVCVNEDMVGQADFPVKIISAPYEDIHSVETVMSRDNFKKFLNSGFLNNVPGFSADKKAFMVKWCDDLKIQAQQAVRATPYHDQNPKIISKHANSIPRDDGLVTPVTPASLVPISDEIKEQQQTALAEKMATTTSEETTDVQSAEENIEQNA